MILFDILVQSTLLTNETLLPTLGFVFDADSETDPSCMSTDLKNRLYMSQGWVDVILNCFHLGLS